MDSRTSNTAPNNRAPHASLPSSTLSKKVYLLAGIMAIGIIFLA